MNLRKWHRHLACSGLTGWKPVPLCSRRPDSWPQLTSDFWRCSLPMNLGAADASRRICSFSRQRISADFRRRLRFKGLMREIFRENLSSPDGRGQGEGRRNLKSEIDRSLLTSTATRFTESLHSFPPRIGAMNGGARLRRALISPSDRKLGLDGVSPHRVHG